MKIFEERQPIWLHDSSLCLEEKKITLVYPLRNLRLLPQRSGSGCGTNWRVGGGLVGGGSPFQEHERPMSRLRHALPCAEAAPGLSWIMLTTACYTMPIPLTSQTARLSFHIVNATELEYWGKSMFILSVILNSLSNYLRRKHKSRNCKLCFFIFSPKIKCWWELAKMRRTTFIDTTTQLCRNDFLSAKSKKFHGTQLSQNALWTSLNCNNSYLLWSSADNALFQITCERAPDLQCKFGKHWKPGLSRPGRPIVRPQVCISNTNTPSL